MRKRGIKMKNFMHQIMAPLALAAIFAWMLTGCAARYRMEASGCRDWDTGLYVENKLCGK